MSGALLRGKARTEADRAVEALSARYLRLRPSDVEDLSLARGLSGTVLANAALERALGGGAHRRRAAHALDRALRRLAVTPLDPGLFSGVTGVGWVVAHTTEVGEDGEDPCAAFDAAVARTLEAPRWDGPFDLVAGLVGFGVYALERGARPPARLLLAKVVAHLERAARPRRPGLAWWSNPEWTPGALRPETPMDWNLGVAHGVPGVVAFLGRVLEAPDLDARTRETARTLLDGAVEWLLAQELPATSHGCFGLAVGPGVTPAPTRLAWCYGDPGIAAALVVAARAAREPRWERAALRVGLRAAARLEAGAGVVDAGLCHGAAGVAHVFHRLYRATGERRFAAASRAWFARTLAMRGPETGFAGFREAVPDVAGNVRWRASSGFLTGAAGITLALVAATTDMEPAWDRVLLLS